MQNETPTTFKERLKTWMIGLSHKDASKLLQVEIRTLQRWLYTDQEPTHNPSIREIEERMKEPKP